MTVKEAWKKSKVKFRFGPDGHEFAEVYWRSPTTGVLSKEIYITISGSEAIEISKCGLFLRSYPASADHYEPATLDDKKSRIKALRSLIKDLKRQLAEEKE